MTSQISEPTQKLNQKETAIVEYIKDNENDPKKLTINQVASAMNKRGVCSRLTTNKIILDLINLKILKDEKQGNKFHHLKINDEYYYDFNKLEGELLKSQIQKALEPFKTLLKSKKMEVQIVNKAKGETDIIIGIESAPEKTANDLYTPRQLQKMAMDHQKMSNNQLKKRLFGSTRKARNQTGIK